MVGNVWEWTLDCYAPDFYANAAPNDPVNLDPDCLSHALKGGSWDNEAGNLRAADRGEMDLENYRNHSLGFRCALLADSD
jgi:formylglycine-generating enzyme required for sulfatase activity